MCDEEDDEAIEITSREWVVKEGLLLPLHQSFSHLFH